MSSPPLLEPSRFQELLRFLFSSKSLAFQTTADSFQAAFQPSTRFAALCAALVLLEESRALLLPQRLAAWYLLYSTWPDGPAADPFIGYLLRAAESASAAFPERVLCLQLLAQHELEQLRGRTPQDYVLDARGLAALAAALPLDERFRQDVRSKYACLQPEQQQQPACSLPAGTLEWQRPPPPPLPTLPNELHWLYPDLHTSLVWDSTLGESGAEAAEVRELVARALRAPLLPAQQQRVQAALDASPRLVHRLGVLPQHLPALVEHCPALASALLLRMLRPRPCGRAAELLGVLARSELTLHGMEVVNRLAASVDLPPEFVHLYITNCIHSCVNTQDKYVQSRLVRLVCVFLQSLIRNRILAAVDLLHELQAFCINFSRIREAAKLFRLLKQIEGGGAGGCLSPTGAGPSGPGAGPDGPGTGGFRSLGDNDGGAGGAGGAEGASSGDHSEGVFAFGEGHGGEEGMLGVEGLGGEEDAQEVAAVRNAQRQQQQPQQQAAMAATSASLRSGAGGDAGGLPVFLSVSMPTSSEILAQSLFTAS